MRTYIYERWARPSKHGKYHLLPDPDTFSPGRGYGWQDTTVAAICGHMLYPHGVTDFASTYDITLQGEPLDVACKSCYARWAQLTRTVPKVQSAP